MATPLPVFLTELSVAKVLISPVTKRILNKGGDRIAATAKKKAPFLTGSLMRSIRNQGVKGIGDQITVQITAGGDSSPHTVGYATFVEEGTSKMGPQPYMRPALNKHAPQITSELADVIQLLAAGRPGRISGSIKRG
jgi:HK97 gp10 family phage protein